jgi:hypothetical protein
MKKKRGLTPQGWHKSPSAGRVHYQSGYERKFMEWLDSREIKWNKCRERFPYTASDGKKHTYNPDFYLPDSDLYVEIKGMIRMNDPAKFAAFPKDKKLALLGCKELQKLGLDVKDPMEGKKALVPGQWPYRLLEQMPDFSQVGKLSQDLKKKVSSDKFFESLEK